jgi:hypothetical protein
MFCKEEGCLKKKNTKKFENKMFLKIVRPCWLVNMRSYVGCKILHKVTLNEEKNKGNFFYLVFFIDIMSKKYFNMLLTCSTNNVFISFHLVNDLKCIHNYNHV